MSSFGSLVLLVRNPKSILGGNSTQDRNNAKHFFDKEKIKFSTKIGIVDQEVIVAKHNEIDLCDEEKEKKNIKFDLKYFIVNNFNKDNFNGDSVVVGGFRKNKKNSIDRCTLNKKLKSIEKQRGTCAVDSKKNIITHLLVASEGESIQNLTKGNIPIFTSSGSFLPMSSVLIKMENGKITKEKCSWTNC